MRHRVKGKKLGRDIKERKALFRSLVQALIKHGRIRTTRAKAKAITSLIEKLVTKAKDNSRSSLVQLSSFLTKNESIKKLTGEIAPRFGNKVGGYIRMIRLGRRKGDNAEEVLLEWSISDEKDKRKSKTKQNKKNEEEKPKNQQKKDI